MLTRGLMLILMLQTPDVPLQEAKNVSPEEYLTLDEIIANAEIENSKMTSHVDLPKFVEEISELIGPQPPTIKEEYVVSLSNIMTMSIEDLFSFASYEGKLPEENLGRNIKLGAGEARIATLEISADINTVSKYYLREFYAKGVFPKIHQLYANSLYFAYREVDGFMRTLTLVGFDEQTVVFAAVSDAKKVYESVMGFDGQKKEDKMWDDWREPRYENEPLVIQSSSDDVRQVSRKIMVKGIFESDIMNYYTRELTLAGWRMTSEPQKAQEGLVATFEKGQRRRCSVIIGKGKEAKMFEVLTLCQEIYP